MVDTYTAEQFDAIIRPHWEDATNQVVAQVQGWLNRGDGAAVYQNHDLGSATLGDLKVVSFGSPAAQIETDTPPDRLPDIGNQINWRFMLIGTYRPAVEPSP